MVIEALIASRILVLEDTETFGSGSEISSRKRYIPLEHITAAVLAYVPHCDQQCM
jgi:hypothetical protein